MLRWRRPWNSGKIKQEHYLKSVTIMIWQTDQHTVSDQCIEQLHSMDVDFYWRCLLWTPLKMRKRLWCVLTEWQASSDWAEQRAPTYIPFTALSAHAYNAVDVITWSRIGEKSTVRTLIDQLSISEHWLCNRSCLRKVFFDEAIMVYFSPARTWTELWSRPWVYERTGESRG